MIKKIIEIFYIYQSEKDCILETQISSINKTNETKKQTKKLTSQKTISQMNHE